MRPGAWQFIRNQRTRADGWCKRERGGRPHRGTAQAAVGDNVLQRFVGVVERDRPIIVMMVGLLLPMKHRVRNFLCIRERRRLPGDGKGLPKRGEQQKNEGEPTTHGTSLADRSWWISMPVHRVSLQRGLNQPP